METSQRNIRRIKWANIWDGICVTPDTSWALRKWELQNIRKVSSPLPGLDSHPGVFLRVSKSRRGHFCVNSPHLPAHPEIKDGSCSVPLGGRRWQWAAPGVMRKGQGVGGGIQLHLRRFIPRHKIIKRGIWGDNVDWVKSGLGSVPLATRDRQEAICRGKPGLSTWILVIKRTLNAFGKVSWRQNILIKLKWETCPQTLASKEEWGYFSVFGPWVGSVRLK